MFSDMVGYSNGSDESLSKVGSLERTSQEMLGTARLRYGAPQTTGIVFVSAFYTATQHSFQRNC